MMTTRSLPLHSPGVSRLNLQVIFCVMTARTAEVGVGPVSHVRNDLHAQISPDRLDQVQLPINRARMSSGIVLPGWRRKFATCTE